MGDARSNTPRVWNNETDLIEIASTEGPFVTICLATPGDEENAGQESLAQWKSMRSALLKQGTYEVILKEIDEAVFRAHLQGDCMYLIATDNEIRHVSHWPSAPRREFAMRENLPVFLPLLQLRQQSVAHVCATLDRTGAVITGTAHDGRSLRTGVEGSSDDVVRKVNAGGLSQRSYEKRAEDTWEQHARDAAEQIARAVEVVSARRLYLAGDVRAVQLVRNHLPAIMQLLVEEVPGSRANDGSELIDSDAVAASIARLVNTDTNSLVEKFAEERGQQDRAASGAHDVLQAISEGRVEVLLLPDLSDDNRQCWYGEQPTQIALSEDRVAAMGAEQRNTARLVDAATFSALRTNSGVWVVDVEAMSNDIAALLRW